MKVTLSRFDAALARHVAASRNTDVETLIALFLREQAAIEFVNLLARLQSEKRIAQEVQHETQ